jgi:hypothetical protein
MRVVELDRRPDRDSTQDHLSASPLGGVTCYGRLQELQAQDALRWFKAEIRLRAGRGGPKTPAPGPWCPSRAQAT